MDENTKPDQFKFGISLRIKIVLIFFLFISFVSLLISAATYQVLSSRLFAELQRKVQNLARAGSRTFTIPALKNLAASAGKELTEEEVNAVEKSMDYKTVSDQLNWLRGIEPDIVRYVYLVVPTADKNRVKYLVDADLLPNLDKANGEVLSHFNLDMDITGFPVMRQALETGSSLVEPSYSFDEEFKVNSVSGYAPVFDEDGKTVLALLGIDMTDKNVRRALQGVLTLFLVITLAAQGICLLISIILGFMFTSGIRSLDKVVHKFGEKQLDVRVKLRSRDEVGRLGFSFNQMAQTIQGYSLQLENLLNAYSRFVPRDFLKFLEKDSITDVKLGDQVQREMTVLFSDIRSFTTLSETMTPEENFNFINSYLNKVGPVIRVHNGFIDKYIGDAVMALFAHSPEDAVKAGIAMQEKVLKYNSQRKLSHYQPIKIGIGIHTGKLMLGTVGEEERMDGTVISDVVNLASRLEGLTKFYNVSIIISEEVLEALNPAAYSSRYLDKVQVVGKRKAVKIYEIYNMINTEQKAKKDKSRKSYTMALECYYNRDFRKAYAYFKKLLEFNPDDTLFAVYFNRCRDFLKFGVKEEWDGTMTFETK